MTGPVRFTRSLAELPSFAFGNRSLTWWGVVGFMLIEGAGFAMAVASAIFLMNHELTWPPEPVMPPDQFFGTMFTIVILLSEIPNYLAKRAAEEGRLTEVRLLLVVMALAGVLLLIIRVFEFQHLNVSWTTNAYGSIVWLLLGLHTTHILTDWIDTLVLGALMFTRHGKEGRRFVDTCENAIYWRFVWAAWLPIYLIIYLVPRW